MQTIPALDLKTQYQNLQPAIDAAVARVLASGAYILGETVRAFESEFAAYCGVDHAIGVGSGTEAIHLALLTCGIGPGDEVITVAHTAVATVAAIELAGARPVLVDIDLSRYTLDPGKLAAAITPQTRAMIPVHLYGCPVDLAPILEIARTHDLLVIEDCAQAHGATYRGKRVGAWGDLAAFSFYPTKNLGAYGDGGALITNQPALAERARIIRQYGWAERYISSVKGLNTRLDDLQAAVLRVKLAHLDEWNTRRQQLAGLYDKLLADSGLVLPCHPLDSQHVYHLYVIRHPEREALRAFLASQQIHTLVHYPVPVHLQPAYQNLGYAPGTLPATEQAAREVLSLPLYPEMTEAAVEVVSRAIIEFCK